MNTLGTIKVKTYHDEYNNRGTYRTFTIVDRLPKKGDEIEGYIVVEIESVRLDIEAYRTDRNCNYDYYTVKLINSADDNDDVDFMRFAVEKEVEKEDEYEEEDYEY